MAWLCERNAKLTKLNWRAFSSCSAIQRFRFVECWILWRSWYAAVNCQSLSSKFVRIVTHIERFLAIGNVKKCAAPNKHKATVILGAC